MERVDLIVVGGGLAGLAAAALVARGGASVRLLEAGEALGGRARTRVFEGFSVNHGPRALFCAGAARRVLEGLGVPLPGGRPPASGLALLGGRLHALPGGPLSLLTTSLLDAAGKIALSRFMTWLARAPTSELGGRTFGEVLAARAPRPAVRAVVSALARCTTYEADVDDLCAQAAVDQVRSALQSGVLYVDGGWRTLVGGLEAMAREAGAVIEIGARVSAIERDAGQAGRFRARVAERSLLADAVVVATPPATAGRLFPSIAPAAKRCAPLRAACLDVALATVPHARRAFVLGVDVPLYYSLHSASARLADDGAGVAHLMRYGEPSATTEAELHALLARVQPGARLADVRYLPAMIASNARVTASSGGLRGRPAVDVQPGVWLAGDWVGDEGMLADAACASAEAAARRALAFLRAHKATRAA